MSAVGDLLKLGLTIDGNVMHFDGVIRAQGGFAGVLGTGEVYFLDPANGSDNRNGKSPQDAFASLTYAYSKLVANQNDVLIYLAGATELSISANFVWAKSYTHFIGACAPASTAQRARIMNSGTLTKMFQVTATGCIFKNLYLFQGSTGATGLGCFEVTGGRNYFENVHFAGIGHATPGAETGAYALKLNGAEENKFVNCTIGIDTIVRTGDNAILSLDGSSNRNEFIDCRFVSAAENSAYPMVKFVDSSAVDRFLIFKDCLFYNFWVNHGGSLLECFDIPASPHTCDIILQGQCLLVGITEWEDNDRGCVWIGNGAPTAATSGIAVEPAT